MCKLVRDTLLDHLQAMEGRVFRTPDRHKGADFVLKQVRHDRVVIETGRRPSDVPITLAAFTAAFEYLLHNGHDADHPIPIRSHNDPRQAGPLCRAAREKNSDIRCINYILPLMKAMGYVEVDGSRPNRCWYL